MEKLDLEHLRRCNLYPGAERILRQLRDAGFEAYLAGGCVRDNLLRREPKDFDIASSADPEQVQSTFAKTVPIGVRFGTVGVLENDILYQVTRFRGEGDYRDGRHPENVFWSSAEQDAKRRDFTINGLFGDPFREEVIDFVGGVGDLRKGVIRAIGDPRERFREDALRLLRAARFSCRFGFPIEEETRRAILESATSILRVSAERIRTELMMILTESDPVAGIKLLDELRLLQVILPEITSMKGVSQPPQFHPEGDVFVHTLLVLEKLEPKTPILLLAALLHDVAKPVTFQITDRIRFNRHDSVGAQMAEDILRRLAFSNAEMQTVRDLIEQHLHIASVPKMREGKRRRFLRNPAIEDHLALHRADCLGSHGKLDIYEYCRTQLSLYSQEQLNPPKILTGADLIQLGFSPGPQFKEILELLEEEQLEGRIANSAQAREWVSKQFPRKI